MKGEEFLDKLEFIDGEFIEKAEEKPKKKSGKILKFSAFAAAVLLVCIIPVYLPSESPVEPGDHAPAFTSFDGNKFFVSPYADTISDELPEGFEYSGEADIGGYENLPYYTNPDIPEWAYVYQTVYSDGKLDSFGTLIPTEPHKAYLRYVDLRIRGAHLIFLDGNHYISMWSAKPYGDFPDVTAEYYNRIKNTYGTRISGGAPEGFSLIGTTVFSGYDTIPKENLHCNYGVFDVYTNPSEPEVILVSTEWHTAESDKNGTVNKGFDVYIRYDCPLA